DKTLSINSCNPWESKPQEGSKRGLKEVYKRGLKEVLLYQSQTSNKKHKGATQKSAHIKFKSLCSHALIVRHH
ncbi:hypothetical protein ACTCUG_09930, partial [Latilactobacillus sakei]|uniref:hypothetical protein n=1 Tax=Latilactobacillus sakei TaxID=1599 RepID=UPI003F82AC54